MCTFKIRHGFTTKNMCKLPPLFGLYIKYYCLKYFKRCKVRYALSVFKCHLTKGFFKSNFIVVIKILFVGRVESIKSPLFGAIFLCYWITYIVSVLRKIWKLSSRSLLKVFIIERNLYEFGIEMLIITEPSYSNENLSFKWEMPYLSHP